MQVNKKKILRNVTNFEVDDIITEGKFNDVSVKTKNADQLDVSTTTHLNGLSLASSHTDNEGSARRLQVTNEANDIRSGTAEKWHQRQSLMGQGDDVVAVDDCFDNTERKCSSHICIQFWIQKQYTYTYIYIYPTYIENINELTDD